ncbi:restriction endonuclease subunit S [Ursidibacter sp. B-7004-1]
MSKQQTPNIRFQGFSGAWEEKTLGEVLSIKSGMSQKEIEVSDGIYPILATGGEIGRTNTALYDKESVLIGRKGTIDKPYYMNTPFWTVDTLFYSELKDNIDGKFLYFLFQGIEWRKLDTSTGVPSLTSTTIHEIRKHFPTLPEQTQIGQFFQTIDRLIAQSKATLTKSRQLKKAMLAKMFPMAGETVPQIRFKGFTGAWEKYQIDDLFHITRGNVLAATELSEIQSQEYCYPVYSSQTKNKGLMGYWKNYLFENAITWTTDGANAGNVNFRSGKFYCTNVCGVLISDNGFSNQCIAEILNLITHRYVSYVGNPKLMNNVMAEIPIVIPPTPEEQTAIGNFFRQLDDTIALQQAELAKLTQLKKALLAKMLV